MTIKSIAIAAATLAAIGAVAAGVTSVLSESPAGYQVQLNVCGVPLPQEPAPPPTPASTAALPTAIQLTDLLNSLADPSVPFADKSNLVEGGIGGAEARVADHRMQKAVKNGSLPLSFTVANIEPGAPGSATADVSVSGPKLSPPITQNITFVDQGSWILSRSSAMELLELAGAN